MCQHLNAFGEFQSDQYPDMRPDVLSFRDPAAVEALHAFADMTEDDDLAVAIVKRLDAIAGEYRQSERQDISMWQTNHSSISQISCLERHK